MTRFWLWLWWWSRERAVEAVRRDFPLEFSDARTAWAQGVTLGGALETAAWNTDGLAQDLALHDAADYLLGV